MENLKLYTHSAAVREYLFDNNVQQIFVSFEFLNLPHTELETVSVKISSPQGIASLGYNKSFKINQNEHNKIVEFMESIDPDEIHIIFAIVKEPDHGVQDQEECIDIGIAMMNLGLNGGAVSKEQNHEEKPRCFRNIISKAPEAQFKPEANRYHLCIFVYDFLAKIISSFVLDVSLACPWAHRTLIVRSLKGLQSIISVSVVDYLMGPNGWKFSPEIPDATNDPLNGAEYIREIYFKAESSYSGRFTVPVLWDKKLQTIVNNESSEIIRFLNSEFDEWSSNPGVTYYPEHLRSDIDAINEWIYDSINNGVYKAGFATKQEP
ncbi:S-glutathionyl-(chloro)hydroquinone reductase, partial [Nowakowskiella sp. JEL0078]